MAEEAPEGRFAQACFEGVYQATLEWIATNLQPQDVYDRAQLEDWAKLNGWTPPPAE
jgi:hypothetical protein